MSSDDESKVILTCQRCGKGGYENKASLQRHQTRSKLCNGISKIPQVKNSLDEIVQATLGGVIIKEEHKTRHVWVVQKCRTTYPCCNDNQTLGVYRNEKDAEEKLKELWAKDEEVNHSSLQILRKEDIINYTYEHYNIIPSYMDHNELLSIEYLAYRVPMY